VAIKRRGNIGKKIAGWSGKKKQMGLSEKEVTGEKNICLLLQKKGTYD